MPKSVLDAIKMGLWDFEPHEVAPSEFDAADAMPGTKEKLKIGSSHLAAVRRGMRAAATDGSAKRLAAARVEVAGKTGTALSGYLQKNPISLWARRRTSPNSS